MTLTQRLEKTLLVLFTAVALLVFPPPPADADTSPPGLWDGNGGISDWESLGSTPEDAVLLGSAAVGDWLYFKGGAEYIGAGNSANILACGEAHGVGALTTLPGTCNYLNVSVGSLNGYAVFQVPPEAIRKRIALYRGDNLFQGPTTDVIGPRRSAHAPEPIMDLPPSIVNPATPVTYAGQELQVSPGMWQVDTRTSYPLFAVYRCAGAGNVVMSRTVPANCKQVRRYSSQSGYTVASADRGKHLRIAVMVWNRLGTKYVWSATMAVSVAGPNVGRLPVNTVAPWISDIAEVGGIVPADPGDWLERDDLDVSYAPINGYAYTWQRCTAAEAAGTHKGNSCESVGNWTRCTMGCDGGSNIYEITRNDVGYRLRFGVTAASGTGSTTLYTATTDPVAEPPLEAPIAIGTPWIDNADPQNWGLYADYGGGWEGYPAPAFASGSWYRCSGDYGEGADEPPPECSLIDGRTAEVNCSTEGCSSNRYVTAADVGFRVRFCVAATNIMGSGSTCSATTRVVPNLKPTNAGGYAAPQVLGATSPGVAIRTSTGTWLGAPPETYNYSWYLCTAGLKNTPVATPAGCTAIRRATAESYTPVASQAGKYLRVRVTVTTTRWGSASIFSTAVGPVQSPPKSLAAPQITGAMSAGSTLSVSNGTWIGLPTFSIFWWRCTSGGTSTPATTPRGCARISGAISSTYLLTSDDVGAYVRASLVGTNSGGATVRFSAASTQVQSQP